MRALLIVVVAILVNLPVVHEGWTDHRVRTQGRDVEAVVLDLREIGDEHLVSYRLPDEVDPDRTTYSASIDVDTYVAAGTSDRLAVRVVPGDPDANRPDGLVASSLFTVIAVVGDVVLLAIVALLVLQRRRRWFGE